MFDQGGDGNIAICDGTVDHGAKSLFHASSLKEIFAKDIRDGRQCLVRKPASVAV